jgi:cell division protein FtsX
MSRKLSRGGSPLVMRRSFLTIFRVALFVVLLAVLAVGLWLVKPVQTGAGDMSRFQAGTVYLLLAREQPGYCQQGYVVGIVGAMVSSPAIAVDKAIDLP